MNIKPTVKQEVKDLNIRIRGLLPLAYHSCLETISPTSMGSAGLKYDKEGRVAWDEIWTTFCDLGNFPECFFLNKHIRSFVIWFQCIFF